MKPIIKAENIGKQYRIGALETPYATLRESVSETFRSPFKRLKRGNSADNTVWALNDVSFEVMPGELVGIIGRNGAGKSTLLKVLSRIAEPTTGRISLYGRIASLLEVGTGFHPELTGRENIYLNGAILGMGRNETQRKFDDIVAFAEVEKFIDTPVKRYSSGMYLRLAFAVAAHLDPEILVVDEVLAVGDADFQKKCIGKMEEVGSQGRTVLFVSHNMPSILRLCNRAILLDRGQVIADGEAHEVTRRYLHSDIGNYAQCSWTNPQEAPGNAVARLRSVRVLNAAGEVSEVIDIRQEVSIEVEYWNLQEDLYPSINLHLLNEDGDCVFVTNDFNNRSWKDTPRKVGLVRAVCRIPGNFLAEGRFFVLAAISTYNPLAVHVLERDAVSFQVVDRSEGDGVRGDYVGPWPGVVRPMLPWEVSLQPDATVNLLT